MTNPYNQFLKSNLLWASEVAGMLGVSQQRVSVLRKNGELVPIKVSPKSSIYLKQEVLEYMRDHKLIPRYGSPQKPKLWHYSGTSYKGLSFFKDNIKELGKIIRVSVFFLEIDAAVEGHFAIDESRKYNNFYDLDIPHMVIRDENGEEIWINSLNCGYGGAGPNKTRSALEHIDIPESLSKEVLYYPIVNYVLNEGGQWEVFSRESDFDFRHSEDFHKANEAMRLRWYDGHLLLTENIMEDERDILFALERYWSFIPEPVEFIYYPSDEQAIADGCFDGNTLKAYRLVIRDTSGREMWLRPDIEEGKSLTKQAQLLKVLEFCGFDIPAEGMDKRIKRWLGAFLNNIEPEAPHIGIKKVE